MALPQGIAFRSSNAFVTDVSPDFCQNGVPDADTQIDSAEADYPTTSTEGNNCGWETVDSDGLQCRNRNNGNARLAGSHLCTNANDINTWRLDLPSTGTKIIRSAAGDFNYATGTYLELFDTASSLGVLSTGDTSGAATWKDATNVERSSAADWVSNNASVSKTFSTTILRLQMGSGALLGSVSFFFVDEGATAAITGTATSAINENSIVAGGKTIIATLNGATYAPYELQNIVFVGSQSGGFAGTTTNQNITFNLANGIASTPALGDIVIVTYAVGALADRTLSIKNNNATIEYTLMNELYQNDSFDINLRAAYRFMTGTADTRFVLGSDLGGTGNAQSAGAYSVHVFRGVNSTTPMDVTVVNNGNINGHNVIPAAITPGNNGAVIYVSGGGAMTTGAAYTMPNLNSFVTCRINDTQDAVVGAGYIAWDNNGAYTPIGWGGGGTNNTSDSWASITAALRPNVNTPFNDARQVLINNIDSAQSESGGWDAKVRNNIAVGNVARTNNTVVTITLPAVASYDITANEVITVTIPSNILSSGSDITGTPTFTITPEGAGPSITYTQIEHAFLRGAFRGVRIGAR